MWAWENDIKNKFYPLSNSTGQIGFDHDGDLMVITEEDFDEVYVKKSETFEIEEEFEIDENTRLERFLYVNGDDDFIVKKNSSIADRLSSGNHMKYNTKFIYLQNEDGSIGKLIWENGEMIK